MDKKLCPIMTAGAMARAAGSMSISCKPECALYDPEVKRCSLNTSFSIPDSEEESNNG